MAVWVFVVATRHPCFPLAAHSGRSGLSDARWFARSYSAGDSATAKKPGGLSGIGSGRRYSLNCTYLLPRRMTTGEPFFRTLSSRRPSFGLAVETVRYSMDRYSVQKWTMSNRFPCEECQDRRTFPHIGAIGKPFMAGIFEVFPRTRP